MGRSDGVKWLWGTTAFTSPSYASWVILDTQIIAQPIPFLAPKLQWLQNIYGKQMPSLGLHSKVLHSLSPNHLSGHNAFSNPLGVPYSGRPSHLAFFTYSVYISLLFYLQCSPNLKEPSRYWNSFIFLSPHWNATFFQALLLNSQLENSSHV